MNFVRKTSGILFSPLVLKRGFAGVALAIVAAGCAAPSVRPVPASAPGGAVQEVRTSNVAVAPKPANLSLHVTSPAPGSVVPAGSVNVSVDYAGPALVPGAQATALTDYHLHYLLDTDAAPYIGSGLPLPSGRPDILHSAATTVTFENVAAGAHTVTIVMGGSNHVAVDPPVVDQVSFMVQ